MAGRSILKVSIWQVKDCPLPFGMVTRAIGSCRGRIDSNDQASRGSGWSLGWPGRNREENPFGFRIRRHRVHRRERRRSRGAPTKAAPEKELGGRGPVLRKHAGLLAFHQPVQRRGGTSIQAGRIRRRLQRGLLRCQAARHAGDKRDAPPGRRR